MKTTISFLCACLFGLSLLPAQIAIEKPKSIEAIQSGVTFVIEDDFGETDDEKAAFRQVFEEAWTIGKLAFISREKWGKIHNEDRLGYTYIELDGYRRGESTGTRDMPASPSFSPTAFERDDRVVTLTRYAVEYAYLGVYHYAGKAYQGEYFSEVVARVELMRRNNAEAQKGGQFWNWGPGYCKNYLQHLMQLFEKGKKVSIKAERKNAEQLSRLSRETLFVPTYLEYKYSNKEDKEYKENDVHELFAKYPFRWQAISVEELNEKILSEEIPFYYLIHVMANGERYLNIMNSATGEVIYRTYNNFSFNLTPKAVNALARAIK